MFKSKLTDKSLAAVFIVLGLILVALVYFVPYKNVTDEIATLEADNQAKRNHIASLQTYYDNREQYAADTEVLKKNIVTIATSYPSYYRMEDYIMAAIEIEHAVDDKLESDLIYSAITAADAVAIAAVDEGTVKKADIEEFQNSIIFYQQSVAYSNNVEYAGLKDAIACILKSPYRVNIQNVTYTADYETGRLNGAFVLGYYYVSGNGVEYVAPTIPAYISGTSNIFGNDIVTEESAEAAE